MLFDVRLNSNIVKNRKMIEKQSSFKRLLRLSDSDNTCENSKTLLLRQILSQLTREQKKEIQTEPEITITRYDCQIKFDDFTATSIRHVTVSISLSGCSSKTYAIIKPFVTLDSTVRLGLEEKTSPRSNL